MKPLNKVKKNKYGYFELVQKPAQKELDEYYSNQYYQQAKGSYQHSYSKDEKEYFFLKIEQIYQLLEEIKSDLNKKMKLLDIGCGEGWALCFFSKIGWKVKGLDYSNHGCKKFNPECLNHIDTGDVAKNIDKLVCLGDVFDVIWLGNVLEHILNPLALLNKCSSLLSKTGIIIIKVPNDFSAFQQMLLKEGYVDNPYWVAVPDHISYFNQEGLTVLCRESGLESIKIISDYPIDFNLLNENTNYVKDSRKGRSCHLSRLKLEAFFHSISIEKTNQLYQVLADMGIGREIIGFFRKATE